MTEERAKGILNAIDDDRFLIKRSIRTGFSQFHYVIFVFVSYVKKRCSFIELYLHSLGTVLNFDDYNIDSTNSSYGDLSLKLLLVLVFINGFTMYSFQEGVCIMSFSSLETIWLKKDFHRF
ncbi:unnamed protein product [Rhizophagus irregularis]|nr:unnamed protein product [Rhizophagus irregularis]CAB5364953.1 unnamed protein product [Rhizophagus irregularis]